MVAGRSRSIAGLRATGSRWTSCARPRCSKTLTQADWNNTTILSGDLAQDVGTLRQDIDGMILIAGSGRLVQCLLAHGLVDELRLMVFPVVLGSGRRLFADTDEKLALTLAASQTVGDGVAILTYQRRPHSTRRAFGHTLVASICASISCVRSSPPPGSCISGGAHWGTATVGSRLGGENR